MAVKMHITQAKDDQTSERRADRSSRQSRAPHSKLRRSSAELLLLLRFLLLCFLGHIGAPVLKFENAAETDSHKNIPCAYCKVLPAAAAFTGDLAQVFWRQARKPPPA